MVHRQLVLRKFWYEVDGGRSSISTYNVDAAYVLEECAEDYHSECGPNDQQSWPVKLKVYDSEESQQPVFEGEVELGYEPTFTTIQVTWGDTDGDEST